VPGPTWRRSRFDDLGHHCPRPQAADLTFAEVVDGVRLSSEQQASKSRQETSRTSILSKYLAICLKANLLGRGFLVIHLLHALANSGTSSISLLDFGKVPGVFLLDPPGKKREEASAATPAAKTGETARPIQLGVLTIFVFGESIEAK